MLDHTPERMELAFGYREKMNATGFFLNSKLGSELLLATSRDEGNYVNANYIWDMFQSRKVNASFLAVEAYYKGLKARPIAPDDPRILKVSRIYEDLSMRFGCRRNSNF